MRIVRSSSWSNTELRNLDEPLDEVGLQDNTMILIEQVRLAPTFLAPFLTPSFQGRPQQPGEIKLSWQWYEPEANGKEETLETCFDMVINENAPISEVKAQLCKKLKEEKKIDITPDRLRIREATYRSVGKVYLDSSTMKQSASFLWIGKQFAMQRLAGPDPVNSARDLVITVRQWFPSKWELGPREEVALR